MSHENIERLERAVLALVVQALTDYRRNAATIFREETDQPQDIAEDITREAIESMGVSGVRDRLYGKADIKKAIYVFLPEPVEVALMLDAKAEKQNGDSTATIQMSQTSMRVKMMRVGEAVDERGKLEKVIRRDGRAYQVVTIIVKYVYEEVGEGQRLRRMIAACMPNGALQDEYNPTPEDTIWLAGRNAPTLGEGFRARLSYEKLRDKAAWRVREIDLARS